MAVRRKKRQPALEARAQDQQAPAAQLVEQKLWLLGLRLQGVDEFEQVLLGDGVGRHRRELAQEVVDDRPIELFDSCGQIGHLVGGVGEDPALRLADLAEGPLEEGIEGGGDEELERGDLRQL